MVFYIGCVILAALAVYCWLGIDKAYGEGRTLPWPVSASIWTLDGAHLALVSIASARHVWELEINKAGALAGGAVLAALGLAVLLAGMITFRSLRRISGMESPGLIAKGIYRWSRNPQYLGWFICLVGISLMGRSGLALVLTAGLIIGIHLYNTRLEEPYLERVFGDAYRDYKSTTARYLGPPKTAA